MRDRGRAVRVAARQELGSRSRECPMRSGANMQANARSASPAGEQMEDLSPLRHGVEIAGPSVPDRAAEGGGERRKRVGGTAILHPGVQQHRQCRQLG